MMLHSGRACRNTTFHKLINTCMFKIIFFYQLQKESGLAAGYLNIKQLMTVFQTNIKKHS